ncbi:MAG: patatin-like phospholipase family protein, partial [Deltaproteobacteria bacterium]|nr:patatin-like phospholipase family protein [Deltaproteobacteria bacterium]
LVFEGGGVKGIAYVGAMEALRERGIVSKVERVGGTSAGAINAVLVALNYSEEETREVLWKLDFTNFMDDSWGILRDFERLKEEYGWYKGKFFRDWMGALVRRKTGNAESTFADIKALQGMRGFNDLYLVGTNLSTRCSEVFSCEHTPRMCVADAARISMSIPLFSSAMKSPRDDVYVDGGVLRNYPIKLFDREKYVTRNKMKTDYYTRQNQVIAKSERKISRYIYNKETLGFRLDSKEQISMFRDHAEPPRHKIDDLFSYVWSLVEAYMEAQQNSHLHSDDWQRTIYIDSLGVKTTQFDLADETKQSLIDSGEEGVKEYFDWFDTADAVNK